MTSPFDRVILIVLDSVGVGAAPDANRFGDEGSNTLGHIDEWCTLNSKSFRLPNLAKWGLGNLLFLKSAPNEPKPKAATGLMREMSPGKDTTTGHWELAGCVLKKEFPVYPEGFSDTVLRRWADENNLAGWLCNKPASGTTVIEEFGAEHMQTGKPIVYTSGDSVWQIAASEETFGLQKLYDICKSARKYADDLGLGRVIARPFVGNSPATYKRTENRRDYSEMPPSPHLLDVLVEKNHFVAGIGKIEDIFAHRAITIADHTGRNETSLVATVDMMKKTAGQKGIIFTNLIDFDMLHGHRRNPSTYADALMDFDKFLPQIEAATTERDLVILTADHGNDPTHSGTDHTREKVPLLMWSKNSAFKAQALGELSGFHNVARITLDALGLQESLPKIEDLKSTQSFEKLWSTR